MPTIPHAILYVDDEKRSLKYFKRTFENRFNIYTADNIRDGFDILRSKSEEIGVLMSDHRMPEGRGIQLLKEAREFKPGIIRLLVTAYSDIDVAVEAINEGKVFQYVEKPWDIHSLECTLEKAFEIYHRLKPCWESEGAANIIDIIVTKRRLPPMFTNLPYKKAKRKLLDLFEELYFENALTKSNGNISQAARMIQIDRRTIQRFNQKST
jgi:DNA-binding NtrC family response regulator